MIIFFCSCSNEPDTGNSRPPETVKPADTAKYTGLQGTWIMHKKNGFTLIEIKDTAHVLYYAFYNRGNEKWYYRSNARMGYWRDKMIWIATDKFRMDYKISGDTLIEYDKMGEQARLIRVYTEDELAFHNFDAANLNGELTHVVKVDTREDIVVKDTSYSFTSVATNATGSRHFAELATVGDSIIKPAYADTIVLYKKHNKQYFKFRIVRP
ncbi:MAG TPA: hypothetical protein VD996_06705 [Chitinophagaceae bacterium]|nr:hypothetical protein [Chitinophagaceae bacterium]